MAFTLRILIEGLCVFFPDEVERSVEAIFPRFKNPEAKDAHTCQLSLRRGTIGTTAPRLPMTLTNHDLDIYDGPNPIPSPTLPTVHSLGLTPKLRHVLGMPIVPRSGVRRHTGSSELVAARISLPDGDLYELYPTREVYEIYDRNTGIGDKDTQTQLFQCLAYERRINHGTVTIKATDGTGNMTCFEVGPSGNYAEFTIGNFSHHETYAKEGERTDSPHFGIVFGLFENVLKSEYGLRLAAPYVPQTRSEVDEQCDDNDKKPKTQEIRGLHLPCVGGCTC